MARFRSSHRFDLTTPLALGCAKQETQMAALPISVIPFIDTDLAFLIFSYLTLT
jgi:hypothetical protein